MDVEDLILLTKGLGGCPMAQDDLTGNMETERLVSHFYDNLDLNIFKKVYNYLNLFFNLTDEKLLINIISMDSSKKELYILLLSAKYPSTFDEYGKQF